MITYKRCIKNRTDFPLDTGVHITTLDKRLIIDSILKVGINGLPGSHAVKCTKKRYKDELSTLK